MFAIFTFRHSGPLKNFQTIRAANVHNARTKPLAHAMPGSPAPEHLIGTGDLERDVKSLLRAAKINPDRLRKNGVIAYEGIMTASAAYFEQGTPEERRQRLVDWVAAQVAWALERYGAHRIASMVLHVDEKTPHIHLVLCPLEEKEDARFNDVAMRWSLVGRTISGPGMFDEAQDAYAAAMTPLGLVRGVKGSGRKHEPVPVYLARMAAKEQAVDSARDFVSKIAGSVAVDREMLVRERAALAAKFEGLAAAAGQISADRSSIERDRGDLRNEVAAERRKLAEDRADVDKAKAAHVARVAEEDGRLAVAHEALRRDQRDLTAARVELGRAAAKQRADAIAMTKLKEVAATLQREAEADRAAAADVLDQARTTSAKINEHRAHLLPTFRAAADFRKRVEAVRDRPLTPAAASARAAALALQSTAMSASPPAHEVRENVLASYALIQQRAASIEM